MQDILSKAVLSAAHQHLTALLDNAPQIIGAFLATDDGFELTQVVAGKEFEPARLAAICSSIIALSHALVVESELGEPENFLIEAKRGKILLFTIDSTPKLSLAVIAKPTAMLGQVLFHSKSCASEILATVR